MTTIQITDVLERSVQRARNKAYDFGVSMQHIANDIYEITSDTSHKIDIKGKIVFFTSDKQLQSRVARVVKKLAKRREELDVLIAQVQTLAATKGE